jgi:D5 N terminal like
LYAHVWHISPSKHTDWVRDVDAAEASAGRNGRHDVYVGAGLAPKGTEHERVKIDTAEGTLGLLGDVDYESNVHKQSFTLPPDEDAALAVLGEMKAAPTAIIHSGHGIQAWWLFRKAWRFKDAADKERAIRLSIAWQAHINAKAAAHGWRLDNVGDLSRVLRVPGTINAKTRTAEVPVHLLQLTPETRYTPDELEAICAGDPVDTGASAGGENGAVTDRQRFTQAHPCPICNGYEEMPPGIGERCWGFLSEDGAIAFCTREKYAGDLPGKVTRLGADVYPHRRRGPCGCGETHSTDPNFTLDDTGNALRFAVKFGGDYRYNHDTKQWHCWDGARWAPDAKAQVQEDAKTIAVDIFSEALRLPDGTQNHQMLSWAKQSGMEQHIAKLLKLATSIAPLAVVSKELDADPVLLAFPNGYLSLKTGEFTPPRKEALVTMTTAAPYDPHGTQ